MGESDLYIGKAGGITLAECFSMNLPVILYEVLPMQETSNLDFTLKNGFGYYCNSVEEIIKEIKLLIKRDEIFQKLKTNLRKYNNTNSGLMIARDIMSIVKIY